MNYHNKKFRLILNTENGELSSDMVFEYKQQGNIVHCNYSGINVQYGQLIGLVDSDGNIDIRYHQINNEGEIKTGTCFSKPKVLANGKIQLHEKWQWTSEDLSHGESLLEEI